MDGPPTAIPVRQGGGPLRLIAPAQPPNLSNGDAQQAGRVRVHQRPRQQMVQHEQAALFRASQRDPVPLHGRTKSQNYSGRTESQNYNTLLKSSLTSRVARATPVPRGKLGVDGWTAKIQFLEGLTLPALLITGSR